MIDDTIAAIATPLGTSALGIVRMSGSHSLKIMHEVFRKLPVGYKSDVFKHQTIHHGIIIDNEEMIDEAMVTIMESPNSYTGEDIVEFICHGNVLLLEKVLELCILKGARPAEPGEFTKRSFLNGKMDLTQAEAVNQLIHSKSEKARNKSIRNLKGELRDNIISIREKMVELNANINADIEWGDTEGISTMTREDISYGLDGIKSLIESIIDNAVLSQQLLRGFKVVICGKPNAGKSSLFNALLKESRSIISNIPGTTRDVVDSNILIDGYLVNFVDTAGIGVKSAGSIDQMAADKSKEAITDADLIIYVIDGKAGIGKMDYTIKKEFDDKKWIAAINKTDLQIKFDNKKLIDFCGSNDWYQISCKESLGIFKLIDSVKKSLKTDDNNDLMITSRQKRALHLALRNMIDAKEVLIKENYVELLAYEIQNAMNNLGKIDGTLIEADILDKIFSEFCIGK